MPAQRFSAHNRGCGLPYSAFAGVTVVHERGLATADYFDKLIDGSQSVTDESEQ